MDAAHKSCESYRATSTATLNIQYAVQRLEKEALLHRVELLQHAIDELDHAIIQRNAHLVEVHTLTSPMLYSMQSVRSKLVSDQLKTGLKLAAIYVPDEATSAPLKQLILEKQNREAEAQRAAALANRQNTWDVEYEAGGRQRLTPLFQHTAQPYGEITFRYNFGSSHNNTHLEKAATAFTEWKKLQDGEVVQNAKLLGQQISQSIAVYQAQLDELRREEMEIDNNLQRLVGVWQSARRRQAAPARRNPGHRFPAAESSTIPENQFLNTRYSPRIPGLIRCCQKGFFPHPSSYPCVWVFGILNPTIHSFGGKSDMSHKFLPASRSRAAVQSRQLHSETNS